MDEYRVELVDDFLAHYGILGMKWGVRRFQNKDGTRTPAGKKREKYATGSKAQNAIREAAYAFGAKAQVKEPIHRVKRYFNTLSAEEQNQANKETSNAISKGVLTTDEKALKSIEKAGIERHKDSVYSNLNDEDISRFKKYTDAAIYSRTVNTYLATGSPAEIAQKAKDLKDSLSKNKIDNQVVYRSCNLNFTTDGVSKKLNTYGEDELKKMFDSMSKNFKGKNVGENRVYSTSTSPLFAIDTWRKVNPNAAKSYNAYMIINCKGTPGVYADGRTQNGKTLVNTQSNQECILAPNKLTYQSLSFDTERQMFVLHVDAK